MRLTILGDFVAAIDITRSRAVSAARRAAQVVPARTGALLRSNTDPPARHRPFRCRRPCALDTPAERMRAERRVRITPTSRLSPARSVRASGPGTEPARYAAAAVLVVVATLFAAPAPAQTTTRLVHDHDGRGNHVGRQGGGASSLGGIWLVGLRIFHDRE